MAIIVTITQDASTHLYQHNAATGALISKVTIAPLAASIGIPVNIIPSGAYYFLIGDLGVGVFSTALDSLSLCFAGACVGVGHDGTQYVAFMQDGGILTSPDASVWTTQPDSGAGYSTYGACTTAKYWISGANGLRSSADLIAWATEATGSSNYVFGITEFAGSIFRQGGNAVGYIDNGVIYKDGTAITDSAWSGLGNVGSHVVVAGVYNGV